jgi:membrane associated rhomboid family serine protease
MHRLSGHPAGYRNASVIPLRDNIPTTRKPVVTYAIIAANVLVYFFWQRGGLSWGSPTNAHYMHQLSDYGAYPYEFVHPDQHCELVQQGVECGKRLPPQPATWITPFTAMFMHGGLLHIGGNMLFLWIFGNNVEDSMGRVKFLVFYVVGGLCAFAVQTLASLPGGADQLAVPTLGASGAIAAVLGGYLLLFPRARVVTVIFIIFFFTILELPALLVLGFWFLEQAYSVAISYPSGGGGGVAYGAHVGGFLFGLLTIKLFSSRRRVAQQASGALWRR